MSDARVPHKRALLVGVNKYSMLAANYQLSGCVNDIEMMSQVLREQFGFSGENVRLLRDEEATRAAILREMETLANEAGEGDIVVFHYSGHGSQMTDREGDELDGLDETILPCDSGRGEQENRDITDDEIYLWLSRLSEKTRNITLIFDCCHSGTMSRDPFGAPSRWVEPDLRPVNLLPPSPVGAARSAQAGRDVGPSGWLPLSNHYVMLAGCRDEESSFEYWTSEGGEKRAYGTFTYFLCRALVNAPPGSTYRDIFEQAALKVTAAYPRQHPQMEGTRDRLLFGPHDFKPMRFVPVRERDRSQIILGAGAAHGLTVNSRWTIYPPATKQVSEETPELGRAIITNVRAVTSEARIDKEDTANPVTAGSRAVEEAHHFGSPRLLLDVPPAPPAYEPAVLELLRSVDSSALLRRATPGEVADVRLYVVLPRSQVNEGDAVPQLGALTRAVWAVVGHDGQLLMPAHPVEEPGSLTRLCDNLETRARYQNVLKLNNPRSVLDGKVDFTLLRRKGDGQWVPAEPEEAGGEVFFDAGDRIALRVINKHDAPIFISVLDLGLTGTVSLLYPVAGANEQFKPSRAVGENQGEFGPGNVEIGTGRSDGIQLFAPADFPRRTGPGEADTPGGIEVFKLLATTHEADFSWLEQPGYRHAKGDGGAQTPPPGQTDDASSPLEQLLFTAVAGGDRDACRVQLPAEEDWTTLERKFFLRL